MGCEYEVFKEGPGSRGVGREARDLCREARIEPRAGAREPVGGSRMGVRGMQLALGDHAMGAQSVDKVPNAHLEIAHLAMGGTSLD